eukprot:8783682-Pyramimonas_sp.AAC.1
MWLARFEHHVIRVHTREAGGVAYVQAGSGYGRHCRPHGIQLVPRALNGLHPRGVPGVAHPGVAPGAARGGKGEQPACA